MRVELFLISLIISTLGVLPHALSFQWEDEDSVIVEALTSTALLKRRGGKFPFTWPWESQGFGFGGRARADNGVDPDFTCYTTLGEQGVCATLRECYPMLYSVEYGKERQETETANLIDTLKSISGPCDMPNFSRFRIDMPESLICCPSRIVFPEPGLPSTTTTTEPPTTSRSTTTLGHTKSTPASTAPPPTSPTPANSSQGTPASRQPIRKKPPTEAPIPDAVAAHYHREHSCGFINETAPEGMGAEEAGNRFPWIVALVGNRGHFCAGSLIDRYNVLTSASCTYQMKSEDVSNLQVYLGDYKLNSISDGPLIVRKVARIIYHRGFDDQTLKNDIALLRFKLPAPVGTPRVLPVCLPRKIFVRRKAEIEENLLVGVEATLAGWGRNWNPSPIPVLQKAKMRIWSNADCRIKYGYLARSGITDHMLCAYPPRVLETPVGTQLDTDTETMLSNVEKVKEPPPTTTKVQKKGSRPAGGAAGPSPTGVQDCVGDTGGPLVILNEDKKYEQVGIVSWNIGCSHYPYIHTRVGSYLNWIEKNRQR